MRGGKLEAGDDAQDARWIAEAEVPWKDLCFDHADILRDYFRWSKTGERRKL